MTRRRTAMAGLGLVEILVALALGLFIVLVGIALLLSQLREQHRRLAETRLRQEVRAVLSFAEHDVRRAGQWGRAESGSWAGQPTPAPQANPYAAVIPDGNAVTNSIGYAYSRDTTENQTLDAAERFGLRLNATSGAIEARLGDAWQALTDPQVARFVALSVAVRTQWLPLAERCTLPCPPGSIDCPPRQAVRALDIAVTAQAAAVPALQLQQQRAVLLPTDALSGRCPV